MSAPTNRVAVIDCSGSMAETIGKLTKLGCVARAIRQLVPLLPPRDCFGIVSFSESASTVLPLTPVRVLSRVLDGALSQLKPTSTTNMIAGITAGITVLSARPPQFQRKMILLSDGLPTHEAAAFELPLARAVKEGVCIDTIAFGISGQVSKPLLRSISARTGGTYSYAAEFHHLVTAFRRAA